MHLSSRMIKMTLFMLVAILFILSGNSTMILAQQEEHGEGLKITLSVYSGRPNPQWIIEPGPEYERLIGLIRELKIQDEPLFDYEEWNRLGYASFLIDVNNIEGLPNVIHVWRDMAVVPVNEEETTQAVGATELYDILVAQAEQRDYGKFFVNYRDLENN